MVTLLPLGDVQGMRAVLLIAACAALGACAELRPDSVVSPRLDSGITSSNGGGARALGGAPNVGITTQVAPH